MAQKIYEQSLAINRRLEDLLRLIRKGSFSTPALAASLGVSIPTVSRCLKALRERGYAIRSERAAGGWRYVLATRSGKRKTRQPAERDAMPSTRLPEAPTGCENAPPTGAVR